MEIYHGEEETSRPPAGFEEQEDIGQRTDQELRRDGSRPVARLYRRARKNPRGESSAAARIPRRPARRPADLRLEQGRGGGAFRDARAAHRQAQEARAEISEQEEQEPEVDRARHAADLDARRDEGHEAD